MMALGGIALMLVGSAAAEAAAPNVLPPHLAESGIPTQAEMAFGKHLLNTLTSGQVDPAMWVDSSILPFCFTFGGRSSDELLPGWKREAVNDGVRWTDPATGLRVSWRAKSFTDSPAIEWVLELENTSAIESPLVEDVRSLRLSLAGGKCTVHGANGGRSQRDDLMPFSVQLPRARGALALGTNGESRDPDFYACQSSDNHLPFFSVEMPEGRGLMVGVGWTGQWVAYIGTGATATGVTVGLKECSFRLKPGEKLRFPKVLVLPWEGKRLHGHNMLRQVLYKHYIPKLDGEPQQPLVTVNTCFTNNGMGGFLYCGEKDIQPLIAPFTRLGMEAMVIDAGWWDCDNNYNNRIGCYEHSPSRYPNGFRKLSDQLAAAGVRLGLWMPVETIDSTLDWAKNHPDLVEDNRWSLGPWRLRMEQPEARKMILDTVDRLSAEQGIGLYRQDFYTMYHGGPQGRSGVTEIQHLTGLYKMLDDIRAAHPSMIMEGCAGGGRRIDLETLSRFHWHQKSDAWFDSVSDQCGLYGANMFLPGGVVGIPTSAVDNYGFWSSFGGQICLAWNPPDKGFPARLARTQVERYKRLRHLLSGDFYPLTDCSLEGEWLAYQFHRTDLNEGFALIFRRGQSQDKATFRCELRGLDPATNYVFRLETSGKETARAGSDNCFDTAIPGAPAAELVSYRIAQDNRPK